MKTEAEATDAPPGPAAVVAATVNVCGPDDRPVTVHESGPDDQAHVCPPGTAVTVYPAMGQPPSSAGAVQVTIASPVRPVADTPRGAPARPGVTKPTALPRLENHTAPPGPAVTAVALKSVPLKVETTPAGVIRPMEPSSAPAT